MIGTLHTILHRESRSHTEARQVHKCVLTILSMPSRNAVLLPNRVLVTTFSVINSRYTASLTSPMDRALGSQEKGKARTARADFHNTLKRKISTSPPASTSTDSTSSSSRTEPRGTRRNYEQYNTRPTPDSVNKRLQMDFSRAPKGEQASAQDKSQLIVRFYDPDIYAKDALGRQLHQILAWPDQRLESSHNYIQMLFPLPEGSPFNMEAPIINLEVMQAFRSRSELRQELRRSFERMLSFYGFKESSKSEEELQKEKDSAPGADKSVASTSSFPPGAHTNISASKLLPYHIVRTPGFRKKFANWAVQFDHNHLRITRILRSLRVLGLQKEYKAFFAALERAYNDPMISISAKSMGFWRLAVESPLHLAPDGKKCKWLSDWEKQQESMKLVDEKRLRDEQHGAQETESIKIDNDLKKSDDDV
ncbi:hypothetical protein B0T12DRAFT_402675 [Alternaria alternata]|nr:hypothetical protein B0T12DRAFT_402675 [Alternaria alternata]